MQSIRKRKLDIDFMIKLIDYNQTYINSLAKHEIGLLLI